MRVASGAAPERLLDSYDAERRPAADENILNSTRSTDFITPKSAVSRTFRDAALALAEHHPFARRIVNSGRLSTPRVLRDSPLSTSDADRFAGALVPGAPAADATVVRDERPGWLVESLNHGFSGLYFAGDRPVAADEASVSPREKSRRAY